MPLGGVSSLNSGDCGVGVQAPVGTPTQKGDDRCICSKRPATGGPGVKNMIVLSVLVGQ